jgi:ribulose-5-phosphate 4-epimerase/fuculose-1-phosphate aldolase
MTVTEPRPAAQPALPIQTGALRPPTFDDVADERAHRKQRLAAALRLFGRYGFGEGVAGHITARDPEHLDQFWVNPLGISFKQMRVSDLILVDDGGTVVMGDRPVNEAAFAIHSRLHAARPDVVAAAHAHSVHAKAFASLGIPVDPLTQDSCAFFDDHTVHPDFGGVVADTAYADELATTLGSHKAVIHQNHGPVTVGSTVDSAAWWFITLERTCQAQLLAMAAGTPKRITDESARVTRDYVGNEFAGWLQFQPLWDDIVTEEPALLR